jgi:hypothetical protein
MTNSMKNMVLLRIYVNKTDQSGSQPVYEVIVERARRRGLAGATVLRGIMGFGEGREVHRAKSLALVEKLPVVIEIADEAQKIEDFLPELDHLMVTGLVVVEPVEVSRS